VRHDREFQAVHAVRGRPALGLLKQAAADAPAVRRRDHADHQIGRAAGAAERAAGHLDVPGQVAVEFGHDHGRVLRPRRVRKLGSQGLDRDVPLARLEQHERALLVQALFQPQQRGRVARPGGPQPGSGLTR
jgi:hypothetical protein